MRGKIKSSGIGKQYTTATTVLALTLAYFILDRVKPIQTLDQVISGVGTPLAQHGRVMGVPSIVLNTCGPY